MTSERRDKGFSLFGNPVLLKLETLRDMGQDLFKKNVTMPYSIVFTLGSQYAAQAGLEPSDIWCQSP